MTSWIKKWLTLGGVGLTVFVCYWILPVFKAFLTAFIIAYIGSGLTGYLERKKLPRWAGALVTLLFFFLIIALVFTAILPLFIQQASLFINRLPDFFQWVQHTVLPFLKNTLGVTLNFDAQSLKKFATQHVGQAKDIAQWVAQKGFSSGSAAIGLALNGLIVLVGGFYLLRDWSTLLGKTKKLLPHRYQNTAIELTQKAHNRLKGFARGQLLVMLGLSIIYTVGLTIVGLHTALMVGVVAGLLSFVPYLGTLTGVVLAILSALLQFQDLWHTVGVLAVFVVGQALEGTVLTPLLVGDKIGMHPVAILFAVFAGEALFGFVGILLALPVAAVLMVLIEHFLPYYYRSRFYLK